MDLDAIHDPETASLDNLLSSSLPFRLLCFATRTAAACLRKLGARLVVPVPGRKRSRPDAASCTLLGRLASLTSLHTAASFAASRLRSGLRWRNRFGTLARRRCSCSGAWTGHACVSRFLVGAQVASGTVTPCPALPQRPITLLLRVCSCPPPCRRRHPQRGPPPPPSQLPLLNGPDAMRWSALALPPSQRSSIAVSQLWVADGRVLQLHADRTGAQRGWLGSPCRLAEAGCHA